MMFGFRKKPTRRLDVSGKPLSEKAVRKELALLESWPEELEGYFPENDGEKYWHYKMPTISSLIDDNAPIDRKTEVFKIMLNAFETLSANQPENALAQTALLVTWPDMFGSEVCVFFDANYYDEFSPSISRTLARSGGNIDKGETYRLVKKAAAHDLFQTLQVSRDDDYDYAGLHHISEELTSHHETHEYELWTIVKKGSPFESVAENNGARL